MAKKDKVFKATYLGDEVWFLQDWTYMSRVPKGVITYTLEEAQTLAKRSEWARRMVHEAKKLVGAKVK